jgi:hypothetical protein
MRPSAFADIIFLPEFCFVLKCYAEDFLETRARELRRRPIDTQRKMVVKPLDNIAFLGVKKSGAA